MLHRTTAYGGMQFSRCSLISDVLAPFSETVQTMLLRSGGNYISPACHALRKLIKPKRANNMEGSHGPWQKFQKQIASSSVSEMHLHKSDAWQMAGLVRSSGKANVLAVGQPAIFV